jgi:hypothetical protein
MIDGRFRRDAMVKRYSLEELLKHAENKEDVDRQAKSIEQSLQSHRSEDKGKNVHRVYEKRHDKQRLSKTKRDQKELHGKQQNKMCSYCGMDHENQRSLCPAAEKKCYNCSDWSLCKNVSSFEETIHFPATAKTTGKNNG